VKSGSFASAVSDLRRGNPTIRRGIPVSVRRTADPTRSGCRSTRRRGRRLSTPRSGSRGRRSP